MRLTEEEILSIARERGLEWYLPDFARRIERAVVEKWAKEWEMRADIAMTRGFESHAEVIRGGVQKMRASLEEKE